MHDIVYNILLKYYGKTPGYGYDLCEEMAKRICENQDIYNSRMAIRNYVRTMTFSGILAEAASTEIADRFGYPEDYYED